VSLESLSACGRREGGVLVCTDAAARGIDIPDVTHVVQSSFAASAIDFLHRVSLSGLTFLDASCNRHKYSLSGTWILPDILHICCTSKLCSGKSVETCTRLDMAP
jgi:hypothetical protein